MPRSCPGGGGGGDRAQLELTDALLSEKSQVRVPCPETVVVFKTNVFNSRHFLHAVNVLKKL